LQGSDRFQKSVADLFCPSHVMDKIFLNGTLIPGVTIIPSSSSCLRSNADAEKIFPWQTYHWPADRPAVLLEGEMVITNSIIANNIAPH
jgi:hypothetical protein